MATDTILPDPAAAPPHGRSAPAPFSSRELDGLDVSRLAGPSWRDTFGTNPSLSPARHRHEERHGSDSCATDRTCELIDGVLVEKTVGLYESMLAILIGRRIGEYLDTHNVGTIAGEASMWNSCPATSVPRTSA